MALSNSNDLSQVLNEIKNPEQCLNMCGLHLNDLGINQDKELLEEIDDLFNTMPQQSQGERHSMANVISKVVQRQKFFD